MRIYSAGLKPSRPAPASILFATVRALVQRVTSASVRVGDETVGRIGGGLVILVGVTHDDVDDDARGLAVRVASLRLFNNDHGVMDRSLLEVGGEALVVSQFTLYADTSRGRRPSWAAAAAAERAEPLVAAFTAALRALGVIVATGRFGAHMHLLLENDGPVTLMVERPVG